MCTNQSLFFGVQMTIIFNITGVSLSLEHTHVTRTSPVITFRCRYLQISLVTNLQMHVITQTKFLILISVPRTKFFKIDTKFPKNSPKIITQQFNTLTFHAQSPIKQCGSQTLICV